MKQRIQNKGTYLVDERNRGMMTEHTQAVVMDNTEVRIPGKPVKTKVAYFITENSKLLAGNNTVAIFTMISRKNNSLVAENKEQPVE